MGERVAVRGATGWLVQALIVILAVALPAVAIGQTTFLAALDESEEVPPTGSMATGSATFVLNAAEDELAYTIELTGLDFDATLTPEDESDDVAGLHIHAAPAGVNGGVVFGIHGPQHDVDDRVVSFPGGGVVRFEGAWDTADVATGAQSLATHLAALRSAGLYLNAHTSVNPGGEIRGQIHPELFVVGTIADGGDCSVGLGDGADGSCSTLEGEACTGPCTFRAAIEEANANPTAAVIGFDIDGAGPHEIDLGASGVAITDEVFIDGSSDPDDVVLGSDVAPTLTVEGDAQVRDLTIR